MPVAIPRYLLATIVLLSLFAVIGAMQNVAHAENSAAADDAPFIHDVSDLEADPRVVYGRLDNGLRYAVMRNDTPSDAAAIRMRIATGSLNETDAQRGLAHFLEHMAFNGSENVPEGEMVKRLERHGLAFGADTNASTGFDQTTYKLNLPSVDEDVLDEAFFLMRETADKLLLDSDAIERERGVIASEKRARDSIEFRLFVDRLGFLTQGSGLIDRLPIGVDETIATMPREEFVRFYRGYYRPENAFIVFVGDIETDDAIARIEEYFGDWQPAGEALADSPRTLAAVPPGSVKTYHADGLMTFITLATFRQFEAQLDSAATRRERLIVSLGARIFNARMRRNVENGSARYLSGTAGRFRQYEVVDGMTLRLRTSPDDWQDALTDGEQALRQALEFGFTQQELDEQVAIAVRAQETAVEQANTRKTYASGFGYSYVDALVGAFADERVFTSPQSGLDRLNAVVADLTLDEVNQAFQEAWSGSENPAIYFVSSEPLENAEVALGDVLERSRQIAVTQPEERSAATFAYTDFGPPGEVVSEEYVEDADAHLIRFANNVRLNFKQTDFEDGTINVRVRVGGGFMSMPRKDEGLRRLGLNLLSRSGVEGHTEDDLRTLFAGRRVFTRTRTLIDNDAFEVLGSTGIEDLPAQLNIVTARVSAPAFREEVAEQYFRSMRAWYPTHDASPGSVADKYLPRLVRSGDRRYGYDDLENFLAPTVAQVRDWIEPQLRNGLIEITIVGDVEKDVVVQEVARTLGALPERADQKADFGPNSDLAFPEGSETPARFFHRGAEEQALVDVYWPAPDASDPADAYRMRLLRSLFRNRLTEVLREEMGSTYSPGAGVFSSRLFEGYGYILARVTTTPDDVDIVREGIMRVAEEMASQGADEDAFQRAVTPLIEDIDATLESNGFWLATLGNAQTGGYGLASFRAQEATYRAASADEINALARQVFSQNERSVSAYILPAP